MSCSGYTRPGQAFLYLAGRRGTLKKFAVFLLLVAVIFLAGCQKRDVPKTLKVEKTGVRVYFNSEYLKSYFEALNKRTAPAPNQHRIVEYKIILRNTGAKTKDFVLADPILDPAFKKFVIYSVGGIPVRIFPGKTLDLPKFYYLTEGNPAEVERLAYQSKVRIVWEEGGKKWEKIVSVTPER